MKLTNCYLILFKFARIQFQNFVFNLNAFRVYFSFIVIKKMIRDLCDDMESNCSNKPIQINVELNHYWQCSAFRFFAPSVFTYVCNVCI